MNKCALLAYAILTYYKLSDVLVTSEIGRGSSNIDLDGKFKMS